MALNGTGLGHSEGSQARGHWLPLLAPDTSPGLCQAEPKGQRMVPAARELPRRPELPGEGKPVNPPALPRTAAQRAKSVLHSPHTWPGAGGPDPGPCVEPRSSSGHLRPSCPPALRQKHGELLAAADLASVLGGPTGGSSSEPRPAAAALGSTTFRESLGPPHSPPPTPRQKFAQDALAWVIK